MVALLILIFITEVALVISVLIGMYKPYIRVNKVIWGLIGVLALLAMIIFFIMLYWIFKSLI